MSRQLRVQFPGAIYHVTSRGNRRQDIVEDDHDRDTFFGRLGDTVYKYGWEMFSVGLDDEPFPSLLPHASAERGMQFLLSGFASYFNQRHQRSGHLFQGRFRSRLVEDESYFWPVSRYVHLNPVPVLVERPEQWRWSSYAGYIDARCRLPWIAYDKLLDAWQGAYGGRDQDVVASYRQYVEAELGHSLHSPFEEAIDGWILGSQQFAERIRQLVSPASHEPQAERVRREMPLELAELRQAVCQFYEIDPAELALRGSRHPARMIFAALARSYTTATFTQLSADLGLSRRDSVPNLLRRFKTAPEDVQQQLALLRLQLGL